MSSSSANFSVGSTRAKTYVRGVGLHPPAAASIEVPERQINHTFVLGGTCFADGPVGLLDLALLEQEAKPFERLLVASEHKATRCVAIEPMNEGGFAGQAQAQRIKLVFEARAALRACQ